MNIKLDGQELWMCRNGHALGIIQRARTSNNGSKIFYSMLLKFRDAVDMRDHPVEADVDCEIEGMTRVFCNVPGCVGDDGKQTVKIWHMDQKLVAALFLGPLYGNKEVDEE